MQILYFCRSQLVKSQTVQKWTLYVKYDEYDKWWNVDEFNFNLLHCLIRLNVKYLKVWLKTNILFSQWINFYLNKLDNIGSPWHTHVFDQKNTRIHLEIYIKNLKFPLILLYFFFCNTSVFYLIVVWIYWYSLKCILDDQNNTCHFNVHCYLISSKYIWKKNVNMCFNYIFTQKINKYK